MLEVALHSPRQHRQFRRDSGPLVLARDSEASALWMTADAGEAWTGARIEIVPHVAGVVLTVAGCQLECNRSGSINQAQHRPLQIPASFTIDDTRFEITLITANSPHRPLQKLCIDKDTNLRSSKSSGSGPSPTTLSRWFAALSSLNHWATSLQELYVQAAQCAVEAVGLDGGIVLRRRDDQWEIAASHLPHPELGIHYDVSALEELHTSGQTLFHGSSSDDSSNEPAIVVSPLRNAAGDLAGAVYGYRSVGKGNSRRTIRYLEAHMIELLAGAVSEGIARIEREAETDRRRVLLEQAAAIAQNQSSREIATDEREVTLLFADLRNSTELSAALEPNQTYELLSHVMECLTAAVIDHDGLIIDYYGDGLAAMWNAPADQNDHPELACRAALRMLQTLPAISSDWIDVLHRELQIGIGIHTGTVHVGNTGTRRRTKYGPRGTTVNLTSRVEAATKQLGVPLLVTSATAKRLPNGFTNHRVCRARMPGLDRPVDLYTVGPASSDEQSSKAWAGYHHALEYFEKGRLQDAADQLAKVESRLGDIPSRFLAEHLHRELVRQNRRRSTDVKSETFRGVITLSSK